MKSSVSTTREGEDAAETSRDPSSSSWPAAAGSGSRDEENEDQHDEEDGLLRNSFDLEFAERSLPEDTFSFLIYCDISSWSFVLGISVFLFQIGIYIILINERNLNFPETTSKSLRIAQVLAILISIITQTDVRKAICLYRDGFDGAGLTETFKGARFWKWSLSIGLRASEGLLGLVIAFLLIMTSNDGVIDLLLNFSAIEFVTMLDDVVFELVREGFFGRGMKKEAKRLTMETYFVSQDCANSKTAFRVSITYFVILFMIFFGVYGYIVDMQVKGSFSCQDISSQFSDEVLSVPRKGFYTQNGTMKDRITYRSIDREDLIFAYCAEEKRWTLSIYTNTTVDMDDKVCNDWLAASPTSKSKDFSLFESASFPWLIKNQTGMHDRVTAHFLDCVDDYKNAPTIAPESSPPSTLSQLPSSQPSSTSTPHPSGAFTPHPSGAFTNAPSVNPSFLTWRPSTSNSPSLNPKPTTPTPLTAQPSTSTRPSTLKPSTPRPTPQPTTRPSSRSISTKTSKSSLFGD